MWIGLALSAVGVLICLALIALPGWRRRRPGSGEPVVVDRVAVDVVSPLAVEGARLPLRRAALVTLGVAVLSTIVAGLPVGLAVGMVVGVAFGTSRGQTVLRVAAIGALGAAAAFVVLKQWRNGYRVDFIWPQWFETTHAWPLAGILLLGLDPVVERLRRRAGGEDRGSAQGTLGDGE